MAFSLNRAQSTVAKYAHILIHIIYEHFFTTFVRFPSGNEINSTVEKFRKYSSVNGSPGLPFAVAAVDGTH